MRRFRVALALAFCAGAVAAAADRGDDLRPGPYLAEQSAPYDGYQRTSDYVTVRDGTRIAVDVFRPTRNGALHTEKLPVVWTQDRYLRAMVAQGRVYHRVYHFPQIFTLLTHGYVIANADTRGTGASFGQTDGWFGPKEAQDAYDVTEWLAAQPWSSGNVGMTSRSYRGIDQYFAAAQAPPHLKAIVPEMAYFDSYGSLYEGGIFGEWWVYSWSTLVRAMDVSAPLPANVRAAIEASRNGAINPARVRACYEMLDCPPEPHGPPAPVDDDAEGQLLVRAIAEHRLSPTTFSIASRARFRDTVVDDDPAPTHPLRSPGLLIEKIRKSKIAAYHIGGWYDGWTRDTALWHRNWPNASKLLIGPWYHPATGQVDFAGEYKRWFDRWLKGIDNGIDREPPVAYITLGAPKGHQWKTSKVWPPANARPTKFYFQQDRGLATAKPAAGSDDYKVDYTTTAGIDNRFTFTGGGAAGGPPYPDMAANDAKALAYSTEPLTRDTEVTGHPVAHVWLKSTTPDVDLFAYLEEVRPDGTSQYVTEGRLRASHRAESKAPYDNLGLPYHRSNAADVTPLKPGDLAELAFDLQPTSILFHAGSRIRVALTGTDRDTFETLIQEPAPVISVVRGGAQASYVELPIVR